MVSDSSRLDPSKNFPEDLTSVDRDDLDILNSRNHRSRDRQYIREGEVDPQSESEHHELREEMDRRQDIRDNSASEVSAVQDSEVQDEEESAAG